MYEFYYYVMLDGAEAGRIIAYTFVGDDDYSDPELTPDDIAEARLEAAVEDGYIPEVSYEVWHYGSGRKSRFDYRHLIEL